MIDLMKVITAIVLSMLSLYHAPITGEVTGIDSINQTTCDNECSTDTCKGFFSYNCDKTETGCFVLNNAPEIVIGKCEVQCIKDYQCNRDQLCENYKCINLPYNMTAAYLAAVLNTTQKELERVKQRAHEREQEYEWKLIKQQLQQIAIPTEQT